MIDKQVREALGLFIYLDAHAVKKSRLANNFTQRVLANKVGLSQSRVSRIERGNEIPVYIDNLFSLVDILKISLHDILRQDYRAKLNSVVEPLPRQTAGPHFSISAAGQIASVQPPDIDSAGNDVARLKSLLPLVRETADDLAALLGSKGNAFPELTRSLKAYRVAVADPMPNAWGLIWGLGVRLEQTASAAERMIADRMGPELEDAPFAALQTLRTLHTPLILATAEGRELQEQADRLNMTRDEQTSLRANAVTLSENLQRKTEMIEPIAAAIIVEAAEAINQGRHPERGTVFGIATIKHTAIILISAAVVAIPGHLVGGDTGKAITMGLWEAAKRSLAISASATAVADGLNKVLKSGETIARRSLSKFLPFRRFVLDNEEHLRHIADITPQMSWMLTYIDYVTSNSGIDMSDEAL